MNNAATTTTHRLYLSCLFIFFVFVVPFIISLLCFPPSVLADVASHSLYQRGLSNHPTPPPTTGGAGTSFCPHNHINKTVRLSTLKSMTGALGHIFCPPTYIQCAPFYCTLTTLSDQADRHFLLFFMHLGQLGRGGERGGKLHSAAERRGEKTAKTRRRHKSIARMSFCLLAHFFSPLVFCLFSLSCCCCCPATKMGWGKRASSSI